MPNRNQILYVESCKFLLIKKCWGCTVCHKCSKVILARPGENLEERLATHQCCVRRCQKCYQMFDKKKGQHLCCLAPTAPNKFFYKLSCLDIETFEVMPDRLLRDNVSNFQFESAIAGIFHYCYVYDYLPSDISNEFSERSGLIKPPPVKQAASSDQHDFDDKFAYPHWNLNSYVKQTSKDHSDVISYFQAYQDNLRKFDPIASADLKKRPCYKFLCFVLNEKHRNRIIFSHFGQKFDMQIIAQGVLSLGITPKCISSGEAILRLLVEPYGIIFCDSFAYFRQSLSSLSARFQLPETKGFFAFSQNRSQCWNIKTRHPPPLEAFESSRDSQKVREDKKQWWLEKNAAKFYDMNCELVKYCFQDTRLLVMSIAAFLKQSYDFNALLLRKFGIPPGWNPRRFKYYVPYSRDCFTLGSYG